MLPPEFVTSEIVISKMTPENSFALGRILAEITGSTHWGVFILRMGTSHEKGNRSPLTSVLSPRAGEAQASIMPRVCEKCLRQALISCADCAKSPGPYCLLGLLHRRQTDARKANHTAEKAIMVKRRNRVWISSWLSRGFSRVASRRNAPSWPAK